MKHVLPLFGLLFCLLVATVQAQTPVARPSNGLAEGTYSVSSPVTHFGNVDWVAANKTVNNTFHLVRLLRTTGRNKVAIQNARGEFGLYPSGMVKWTDTPPGQPPHVGQLSDETDELFVLDVDHKVVQHVISHKPAAAPDGAKYRVLIFDPSRIAGYYRLGEYFSIAFPELKEGHVILHGNGAVESQYLLGDKSEMLVEKLTPAALAKK